MKNHIGNLLLAAILLVGLMTGCKEQVDTNGFKTLTLADSTLTTSPAVLEYRFEASVQIPGRQYTPLLRTNIIREVLGYNYIDLKDKRLLTAYSDSSYTEYMAFISDEVQYIPENAEIIFRYAMNIEGTVTYRTDSLLCYSRRMYVYTGGAHGSQTTTNYIFNTATGERITENELFVPHYEEPLRALLIRHADSLRAAEKLPEQNAYFNNDLIYPNGNVSISANGLNYTFNPYEIAPYYCGITVIELSFDEIKDILRGEYTKKLQQPQ